MSFIRAQPFDEAEPYRLKTVQSCRFHIDIREEWWPDVLEKARVLIPDFAKAEAKVERLKKQVKKLKAELSEKNPKITPKRDTKA